MKYYKTSKFTKAITSTGFVAVVACALVAIGAIAWFVFSRNSDIVETPTKKESSSQEYQITDNSYNSQEETPQMQIEQPAEDVDDSVSDVPYSQEDTVQSEPEKPTFILPITGNISKGYSDTALQYSATYDDMRLHTGVDILCEIGSNIKSAGSGIVKSVVDDANFGRTITVEHESEITIKYCGMGSVSVKENDKVTAGDILGTSGDIPCECADNPHIHIEVYIDQKSTSPLSALGLE